MSGSVLPVVASMVGLVVFVVLLAAVFTGSERLTRRLSRGHLPDHSEEGDAGFGPLYGERGLIESGKPEGPPLRDRDR